MSFDQALPLIQQVVATHYALEISDLTGPRRSAELAWARQLAMYLSRTLTKAPYQTIGRAFGDRDHGTVMHACRNVLQRTTANPEDQADLQLLTHLLER